MLALDGWGLSITSPDEAAAERYRALVDSYVRMRPDLADRLQEAVGGDTAPMARITRGYFMLLANSTAGTRTAKGIVEGLAPTIPQLNEREQSHYDALVAWSRGDEKGATSTWSTILDRWPVDMLAARLEHFELFNFNALDAMLASSDRLRSEWADDAPCRSYLDGMSAFSLEELGRAAVDADSRDMWSIHAVAHVLEMQGRIEEGIEWLDSHVDDLEAGGSFAGHVWWHLGLYHLALGDHDAVLDLIDRRVRPDDSTEGLTLTNVVAMLARLDFGGIEVGDRWAALVEPCSQRIGHHTRPFNDCHFAYALTRSGATDLADELIAGMRSWMSKGDVAADVIADVGLETAMGMAALAAGRNEAHELLLRTAPRWNALGESNAQRDLFTRALVAAQKSAQF